MGSAIADLRVWRRLVGARIRADWQYRTSFFLFLLSQTLVACLDLAVVAAIFAQVNTLGGWTGVEVALLFGLSGIAFGLADLLISQVENASRHIKAGTFDMFLLRPLPPLVHLSASEFALRRVGRVLQPLVVLIGALVLAPIEWSPETALLVPVTLVSGTVIFGSVWVATSSISFWTVDSQEVANAFTYGGQLATSYPIDLLAQWLRRLLTFIVPLAFVAYFPAARLLDKEQPLGVTSAIAWATPVVAVLAVLAARAVWRLAVRHHRSTGS
ncbi:MAG: ABC-2 family transporter protein [Acidimicrobiales bacterium]